MLGKAIGIDFGTSSIKFYKNGEGMDHGKHNRAGSKNAHHL